MSQSRPSQRHSNLQSDVFFGLLAVILYHVSLILKLRKNVSLLTDTAGILGNTCGFADECVEFLVIVTRVNRWQFDQI